MLSITERKRLWSFPGGGFKEAAENSLGRRRSPLEKDIAENGEFGRRQPGLLVQHTFSRRVNQSVLPSSTVIGP